MITFAPEDAPSLSKVTAQDIQDIFRRHWQKRTLYPDLALCDLIIGQLYIISKNKEVRDPLDQKRLNYFRKLYGSAKSSKRAFSKLRAEIAKRREYPLENLPEGSYFHEHNALRSAQISALDNALHSMEIALEIVGPPGSIPDKRAASIAAIARDAWKHTDPTAPAKATNVESPLTKFVGDTLAIIGVHYEYATVSTHLRGERHRPR
jgi:hypothetical protein